MSLAAKSPQRLMDHDPRVGERKTLARGPGRQEDGPHTCGLPDTDRRDRSLQVLDSVVDRQSTGDDAAGGVDIEKDILLRIFRVKKEELGNNQVGKVIINLAAQKNNAILQQTGVDVV